MANGNITKAHIVIKKLVQIVLYFLEVIGVAIIATYISFRFSTTDDVISAMAVLNRIALFYGIYQVVVLIILNNLNDIKADEYLALRYACEMAIIAVESKNEDILKAVNKQIDHQLKGDMFNDTNVRIDYQNLKVMIANSDSPHLRWLSARANHLYEYSKLNWRYSFLLRLIK